MVIITNGARIIRESSIGGNTASEKKLLHMLLKYMNDVADVLHFVFDPDLFIRSSLVSLK